VVQARRAVGPLTKLLKLKYAGAEARMARMNLVSRIDAALPHAIDLRHKLHEIPELFFEEHKTAALIRAELERLGIPFTGGVPAAETATIALVGDESKPCIAFRADIDALPIEEKTGLSYCSTHPGKMHACGHDGHTATLLCTAAVLQGMADLLPVCVKFIWQPAEEQGGGAERLVKAGVLDGRLGPRVKAIFGLHGWPALRVGTVSTRPGPIMACTDSFSATFIGRSCHGAFPHLGIDPIVAACQAVLNLQQCVSREFDPTEPAVVTVGMFNAGTAVNIIPPEAKIAGTARTMSEAPRARLRESIHRRCAAVAQAQGCKMDLQWEDGYPPTVNDDAMARHFAAVAQAALGPENFIPATRPSMGGEDFSYYLEKVPGCFFMVGVCPKGAECYPSLHNNCYDFSDEALAVGTRIFCELALAKLI
jgi:amidohydrolase